LKSSFFLVNLRQNESAWRRTYGERGLCWKESRWKDLHQSGCVE